MVKLSLLLIQSLKYLSVLSTLNYDLVTSDHIVIVAVHRLAVLEHYIVCDIYDVVDRSDAGAGKTDLHPLW